MKNIGLFSGSLELDTSKLKDQLNAIQMAAGALTHNLNEIDALYEEGEKGTYTETMTKPEAVKAGVNYNNLYLLLRDLRETDSISLEARNVLTKIISEHKEYTERSDDDRKGTKVFKTGDTLDAALDIVRDNGYKVYEQGKDININKDISFYLHNAYGPQLVNFMLELDSYISLGFIRAKHSGDKQ